MADRCVICMYIWQEGLLPLCYQSLKPQSAQVAAYVYIPFGTKMQALLKKFEGCAKLLSMEEMN